MTDRQPTYPGRVTLTPVDEENYIYDMERADQPAVVGTPLNKANLLSDSTATQLGLSSADPTVNEALAAAMPLNRGIWRTRTVVPGVVQGTAMTYTYSLKFSNTIYYSNSTPTVDEFGVISFSGHESISISSSNIGDYANTLVGKYFWVSAPYPYDYAVGRALYYCTSALYATTPEGSSYPYLNIPCKPVYSNLTRGSWIGEFSDNSAAHTRGVSNGDEYQFTPAELTTGNFLRCERGFYIGKSDTNSASGRTIATISVDFYPLAIYIRYADSTYPDGMWVPRWVTSQNGVSFTWGAISVTLRSNTTGTINLDRANIPYNYLIIGV